MKMTLLLLSWRFHANGLRCFPSFSYSPLPLTLLTLPLTLLTLPFLSTHPPRAFFMKPFDGLTFCCTSIPLKLREDLAAKIASLGGIHYNDLMSDVNYLIVGNRRTDKYKFCIKNRYDVKFIPPQAITTIYDKWLEGDEAVGMIDHCLLPVFGGLTVCVSRVANHENRLETEPFRTHSRHRVADVFDVTKLSAWIHDHGGTVTDSLTVSNSCVVTTETRGKRYLKAIEWDIPVVHPIWVLDSLLRDAALDCGDYTLRDPLREPDYTYGTGCKVWNKWFQYRSSTPQKEDSGSEVVAVKPAKKNRAVWQSIMLNQALKPTTAHRKNAWDEEEENEEDAMEDPSSGPKIPQPLQNRDLFVNFVFTILGFLSSQSDVITNVINTNGGRVVDPASKNITHVLVPSRTSNQASLLLEKLPDSTRHKTVQGTVTIVTEWFVERCLFYGKIVLDSWGKPLKSLMASAKPFKVCITGFTGIELLHLEKLINYLNFEYCDTLTSDRDLLVFNINVFKPSLAKNSPKLFEYPSIDVVDCPVYQPGTSSVSVTSSKNKIKAAKQWHIPIVSISYIWDIVLHGSLPNIQDLTWCLYAPGTCKPNSMLDYVKSNIETTPKKRRDQGIKFPSPRRNSKRQKFGRIVGRGSPTVTDRLLEESRVDQEDEEHDITNIDELQEDLVGYQDAKSVQESEKLLRKLGG